MSTPFKNIFQQLHLIPTIRLLIFNLESQSAELAWKQLGLAGGGTLELEMGNTPNKNLGSQPTYLPPSSLTLNPKNFE